VPISVAVVADDVTGAADTAAAFARSGLPAAVELDAPVRARAGVLAYSSDSRERARVDASRRTSALARAIASAGFDEVYKKVDSLLRGHVGAEIAATAHALGRPLVLACPALPSAHRGLINGQLVGGERPIDLVASLRVTYGPLVERVDRDEVRAGRLLARVEAVPEGGALVCDATRETDLEAVAAVTRATRRRLLLAGSAGLAGALGRLWASEPGEPAVRRSSAHLVVAVGSMTALAQRQVACLLDGVPEAHAIALEPSALSAGTDLACWSAAIAELLASGRTPVVVVRTTPYLEGVGPLLARRMGELLGAVAGIDGLVVTGGETARAVFEGLGVTSLAVLDEVEPGVVLARADAPRPLEIVLKSGGFGDDATLLRCVAALRP